MKTKPLLLIILSIFLNATGDPYINLKLKPMAINEYGGVLFQTYSDINTYGSYSCSYDKFGWLVVSADSTWLAKGRSYGTTFIDSVVFVEPFDFRQPSDEVKREVEDIAIINCVETDCSA